MTIRCEARGVYSPRKSNEGADTDLKYTYNFCWPFYGKLILPVGLLRLMSFSFVFHLFELLRLKLIYHYTCRMDVAHVLYE